MKNVKLFIGLLIISISVYSLRAQDALIRKHLFTDTLAGSNTPFIYGGRTKFTIQKESKNNVLHLQFDDKTSSGIQISMPPGESIDLSSRLQAAFIRFRIKGQTGKENCFIGILDNGTDGYNKVESKYKCSDFFTITDDWQDVVCPISGFFEAGQRWINSDSVYEYANVNWSSISAVQFSTEKEQNFGYSSNRIASVFIDDLEIVLDNNEQKIERNFLPWKHLSDSISGPIITSKSDQVLFSWFDSTLPKFTSVYTYGDLTDFKILPAKDTIHNAVFATYQNDMNYSGVTIYRNKKHSINVTPYYETGGIEFCVRGGNGGETFFFGILDDESDGVEKKVQTRHHSRKFVRVTKQWQTVQIPFSSFESLGRWWNTDSHYEVIGTIDWSRISEIRFLVDKYANKPVLNNTEEPVKLYFSSVRFLKKMDLLSNEQFWKTFKSDSPDRLICNFNNPEDIKIWVPNCDSLSKLQPKITNNPLDNSNAAAMDYKITLWGSAYFPFTSSDLLDREWSKHNSIKFDFFSSEKHQTCMVMLIDAGKEAWSAHFESKSGWQEVCVPFSRFRQFEWWQPDSADLNGKMDLHAVSKLDIRPGNLGKPGTIAIDNLTISNTGDNQISVGCKIRINQLGYMPDCHKVFTIADSLAKNFILTNSNNEIVFTNTPTEGVLWNPSGEFLRTGDFSGLSKNGTYSLTILETGEKLPVIINSNIFSNVLNDALRFYYFQRSSIALSEKFAGKFKRQPGHCDTACTLHTTTKKTGIRNVSGGWYDAGDYGKYIVNAGISCATLLSLHSLYPQLVGDTLNIPESENNISDLLDEVRYELDWMKRMQDDDGGVFFKVGTLQWDNFSMPTNTLFPRYIIGKSTTSTLNFAAVMAMAARLYKKADKQFSKDCLTRALQAWNWAQKNPSVSEPSESGGTGVYGDSWFNDEFFWAACELFTTTKKLSFKKQVEHYGNLTEMTKVADWQNTGNLGWFTLASNFNENQFKLAKQAEISIRSLADQFISKADSIPYRIPSDQFFWGSNSSILNHAIVMCYAYKLTGMKKYISSVIDIINYIFGNNALGLSFVTGYGASFPTQPHHRIMVSDSIDEPIPGFLVGGPNACREDELSSEPGVYYPFKEPARCYIDQVGAYASNEICINWNAALVFVLGFVKMNF